MVQKKNSRKKNTRKYKTGNNGAGNTRTRNTRTQNSRTKQNNKRKRLIKNLTIAVLLLINVSILLTYTAEKKGYDVESKWYNLLDVAMGDLIDDAIESAIGDVSEDVTGEAPEDTTEVDTEDTTKTAINEAFDYDLIPEYDGNPYVEVNNNIPYFTDEEITDEAFEYYGELDELGRCTIAVACLGLETIPGDDEERGSISSVTPTGWVSVQYDCVEAGYVMNRCHMIGWALSAENANANNLISGTRYMNIEMLEYESLVADYIDETGNHVMYRVTPIFIEDELFCSGLLMEGYSVEDDGEGIYYNVYFYNVQPGIAFDYSTGESWYSGIFLDMDASTVDYEAQM